MSLPERKFLSAASFRGAALAAVAAASLLSACTVRPLYGEGPGLGAGLNAQLSSIAIEPADSRYGQEVRNHLIFLFGGGAGQPADPRYRLDLGVSSVTQSLATQQVAREDEPTAGVVILASNFRLTETGTGAIVAVGKRETTASFDLTRQQFAAMRAARDAENRAARELAELVRLAIAQQLEAVPSQ
jgi:LPS-assembly lipoprotein